MDYRTYSKRIEYLRDLIERERLSSPSRLVEKFDCSERTIRKMINDLRRDGLKINYSKNRMKYFLDEK